VEGDHLPGKQVQCLPRPDSSTHVRCQKDVRVCRYPIWGLRGSWTRRNRSLTVKAARGVTTWKKKREAKKEGFLSNWGGKEKSKCERRQGRSAEWKNSPPQTPVTGKKKKETVGARVVAHRARKEKRTTVRHPSRAKKVGKGKIIHPTNL